MRLIDANIILELLLDQDRAEECGELLAAIKDGDEEVIITDLILDSILIVMESRGKNPSELATFLSSIAAFKGLKLYWLSLLDRLHATEHMAQTGLDFEDATAYEVCRRLSLDGIVSFDKHFEGLPGLQRFEPKDLLQ